MTDSDVRRPALALVGALALFSQASAAGAHVPPSATFCWGQEVQVHGSSSADTIVVADRYVTVTQGKATETIPLPRGTTSLVIRTYGGDDEVRVEGAIDTRICVDSGSDTITALAGSHRVRADGTASIALAGGNDRVDTRGHAASIDSGGGADVVIVRATADLVRTGSGNDLVFLDNHASAHAIEAGLGDDEIVIDNDAWANAIDTDDGDDEVVIDNDAWANTVDTGGGADEVELQDGAYINHALDTGNGADQVTVAPQAAVETLRLGAGNDAVTSGNGHDTIFTGPGYDTVDAGGGYDRCHVTNGYDTHTGCDVTYQE